MALSEKFFASSFGSLPYLFSQPENASAQSNGGLPLIFFLHGAGERGSNLSLIRHYGIPRAVQAFPDFPFITVSPQCPPNTFWEELNTDLFALLDDVLESYPVDTNRIYLTGLSMGGHGTWILALEQPERFAALAPVCPPFPSYTLTPQRLARLREKPIWVFHGAKDDVVPIEHSERMVQALKSIHGDVKFTVYPEARHDSWTPTYANPELYSWFLSHSL